MQLSSGARCLNFGHSLKLHSCMGISYAKLFEAQTPCSNHEMHMLFEHDLKKPKLGPALHA